MESCPVCGAQLESWLDVLNHSCPTEPACPQEQDPMIPVWDQSGSMAVDVDDSSIDLSDSSEMIRSRST